MFGLMDCNNFYASCERVFNPALRGRPVVVLSNNDGCVIARSAEAKSLGIAMGTPAFQLRNLIDSGDVVAFSSNYRLYGDMSRRVMTLLQQLAAQAEIYSIDEAFFHVPDSIHYKSYGEQIVRHVSGASGIPVSVGIAPTKTLAKIANHFAKRYPAYHRVCVIDDDDKRIAALKMTPVADIWGVGRRHASKLKNMGVHTAYDFINLPRAQVRKMMTVIGEKTWCELNGVACIDLELDTPDKKQICTSRSFGQMVSDLDELRPAIVAHAAGCAAKLRANKLCAMSLMPFLCTNRFRPDLPQCYLSQMVPLSAPTNDTRVIVRAALGALDEMYRPKFLYKKAGVIITEIVNPVRRQLDLFDAPTDARADKLMFAIDAVNQKFGRGTLRLSAEMTDSKWVMHRGMLSPQYTTDINDIIEINCGA